MREKRWSSRVEVWIKWYSRRRRERLEGSFGYILCYLPMMAPTRTPTPRAARVTSPAVAACSVTAVLQSSLGMSTLAPYKSPP